ncbi:MAG TPA: aminotransferase class I/II-fold pyridoxal phosphate-dependent enzyme, partial [Aquihabitans sp.]|nr:aminotransferase class I/II-fold pyridoxal phosphate-dependent enzyme [Aquihabitans sp.]
DPVARELTVQLADHLGVDAARVLVGPGSVGLLQQLALAYGGPGAEVAYGWPSFEAYPVFTGLSGATPVAVPLRRQTIDAGALAAALSPRTRLVLVANPNNPTGTALRAAELEALADALPDGCLLVVDEAYREFVSGADVPDAIELLGHRDDVAVLRTFSKAHGLAGLRVGHLVAHPDVVSAIGRVAPPFAVNAVAHVAAAASLAAADELAERVGRVVAERARIASALRRDGWGVPDAQANFVWLPAGDAAADLAVALERLGVVTRPFAGDGVRVTIGTPEEGDRFLAALATAATDDPSLAARWQLPTGARAAHATRWVERLDAVAARLRAHLARRHDGLTEPDPGGDERWDEGQVWAHLAEFGRYWLAQLDLVLDAQRDADRGGPSGGDRADVEPVPFGRTKADAGRIAAIADGRHRPPEDAHADVLRAIDALRARLLELTVDDWAAVGRHETLGELTVDDQLQHFHVGHYEEHADQLDALTVDR